ncbi:MAG: exo-alpha-sialidase [Candidatus Aminicenantales bacterium]
MASHPKKKTFGKGLLVWCLAAGVLGPAACKKEAAYFEETLVFSGGEEGYPVYRIPSVVVAPDGTVLAFCEGRMSVEDQAENDIVMKRSLDGGKTWEGLRVVAEDGEHSLNNPTAVVLRDTGRVLLMFQRYPRGLSERDVVPGWEGDRVCRSFLMWSDDSGETWSQKRDITRMVKRPEYVTSIASGPGIGIQLHSGRYRGRIVFPFNQGPWGDWRVYAVYSDDGGRTWGYGKVAANGSRGLGNEVQFVELLDGTLLLNARSFQGASCRKTAKSFDGGLTWTPLADEPSLVEPGCQGSILGIHPKGNPGKLYLLYSGPADADARKNGTVFLSPDSGRTWTLKRTLYSGPFAYSCLAVIDEKTYGCLYEKDGYRHLAWARFNLSWIFQGQSLPERRAAR